MTNPFARPDQPDSDETIPLVPDSGYADQLSPWSSGYESTAVDPLAGSAPSASGGYTNPVISSPGGYPNPAQASTGPAAYPPPPAPAPAPFSLPPTAPAPRPHAPAPTAPAYEQPPIAYGSGPYEPARDSSRVPAVPAYSYVYAPQQIEHPNAVPALVLGVLGFLIGVTFPIAWYLGAKGNAEVKRDPQRYRSSGMMTAGMVLGIIGTAFMALAVAGMVLLIAIAIAASG
jgi:hypothetical protein